MLHRLNARVRIGTRILGGFALVLAPPATVSVLGCVGLSAIQAQLHAYETVADNVTRVIDTDRDYTDLRRNMVSSAQALGTAGELAQQSQILRTQVEDFLGNIRAA